MKLFCMKLLCMKLFFLPLLLIVLNIGGVLAAPATPAQPQTLQTKPPVAGQGNAPAAVADNAVRAWLKRAPLNPATLAGLPPEEVCRQLPTLLNNPAPPAGTTVNFQNRVARESSQTTRRYTYPVTFPGERLSVLEVTLKRQNGRWQAENVGLQTSARTPTIPAVLQGPAAAWVFAAFSVFFLYLLVRPSFFRRWLAEGWGYLREHRRLSIITILLLYGLFGLGVFTGANLPPVCARTVTQLVEQGVSQLGAAQAYESGNVARAAVVTLYQNFVMGAVVTTYGVAFISFGVLAYVFNGVRFLVLGVPFGFLTQSDPATLLSIVILILVELMAYVLVTAGGGMLLVTLIRGGFSAFRLAFRKLTLMLPIAFLLLVIGAWYEAVIIILPRLLGGS